MDVIYGDAPKLKNKLKSKPNYKKLRKILTVKSGEKVSLEQAQKIGEFLLRVHAIINHPELD